MLNSSKMMSRNIMASLKAIRSNKFSMNLKNVRTYKENQINIRDIKKGIVIGKMEK
jgi:hypothetical protein